MKTHLKTFLCFLVVITPAISSILAQQSTTASGGNATGSEGSVSYSVGQVFYHTHSAAAGSVADDPLLKLFNVSWK